MRDAPSPEVVVFTQALQLEGATRETFLAQACAGDPGLRQKVEALLKSHEQIGDFLEQPPEESLAATRPTTEGGEKCAERIGRYKLLQTIGEGGCGVVYLAEQEEPVRRQVALKVIKPGMDTKSVIARFEAERQALALMDHPGIAKVFDAGSTESGRPYFVMELVRGVKITEYCDQHGLTTEERLELFVQVCLAVQHAHQKGVIHRDIKPANILVTASVEGEALPVIIDFGIAKPTSSQRLTDKTLFTAFEMFIGTPAYMSPEQAALTSVDVDTRTDIYSLGVLLYELLTSSTPFDTRNLLQIGFDEFRKVIREQEPARPSTRLGKMSRVDLTTVALQRKAEPPKLIRTIRGDLDWIAMKALEKDRTRRYETASGLALDVTRFLENETVSARPPSNWYRLQKLAQRNKVLFCGGAFVAVLVVASLILVSAALAKERQARQEAEAEKLTAQTEAAKSQQITRFLENMLRGVGPAAALGQDTDMLRGILDQTAEQVGRELTNQPAVEAKLRGLLGRLYLEIGVYDRAVEFHLGELALHQKLSGDESMASAATLNDLADAYFKLRRLAEAENAYKKALAIRTRSTSDTSREVAETLNGLGAVYRRQRKLSEAEAVTREGLAIRRALFGDEHLDVAESLRNLSMVLTDRGQRAEAEKAARAMLAIRRALLGQEHPLIAASLADVAWVAGNNGHAAEAEQLETEAFGIRRRLLRDEHPDIARSIYLLGERMRQRNELGESHAVLSAALSIQRRLLGADHPDVLATLGSLARILEKEEKWAEAESLWREMLALWQQRLGNESPQAADALKALVRVLLAQKKWAEVEQTLAVALTPAVLERPSSVPLLEARLDLLGRQSRWKEAAMDATRILRHRPEEHYRYHTLAPLLVITQDWPAYEQLCRDTYARFHDTTNAYVADRVAKVCLLAPRAGVDLQPVGRLAELAVAAGVGEGSLPLFQMCNALSKLRLQEYEKAIEWSRTSLNSTFVNGKAQAYAIQAMALWRLGRKDEARAALAQGNALAPDSPSESTDPKSVERWATRLLARIQLKEAEALIHSEASAKGNSGKP